MPRFETDEQAEQYMADNVNPEVAKLLVANFRYFRVHRVPMEMAMHAAYEAVKIAQDLCSLAQNEYLAILKETLGGQHERKES